MELFTHVVSIVSLWHFAPNSNFRHCCFIRYRENNLSLVKPWLVSGLLSTALRVVSERHLLTLLYDLGLFLLLCVYFICFMCCVGLKNIYAIYLVYSIIVPIIKNDGFVISLSTFIMCFGFFHFYSYSQWFYFYFFSCCRCRRDKHRRKLLLGSKARAPTFQYLKARMLLSPRFSEMLACCTYFYCKK